MSLYPPPRPSGRPRSVGSREEFLRVDPTYTMRPRSKSIDPTTPVNVSTRFFDTPSRHAMSDSERQPVGATRRRSVSSAGNAVTHGLMSVGLEYLEQREAMEKRELNAAKHGKVLESNYSFLATLKEATHIELSHAAASLILKDPQLSKAAGGRNGIMEILAHHWHSPAATPPPRRRSWSRSRSRSRGRDEEQTASEELFGVPLRQVVKTEGTDSYHGALGSSGLTTRIPSFVDHIFTAARLLGTNATHLLLDPKNLKVMMEIRDSINRGPGHGFTVDLRALDSVQLMWVFKRFLKELPEPLLTGNLFSLFILASELKPKGLRTRVMHLVVCMMPKVNRDLLEVVLLLLDWLATSSPVPVTVRAGHNHNLSAVAQEMAPILLRPKGGKAEPIDYRQMSKAILVLLEDQHILHEVPQELAPLLGISPSRVEPKDSKSLLKKFKSIL